MQEFCIAPSKNLHHIGNCRVTTILQAVITTLVWKTTETCHNFVEFVGSGETLGSFTIVQTDFALSTLCRFRVLVAANVWRRVIIDVFFVQNARKRKQLLGSADVVSVGPTAIVGVVGARS